VHDKKVSISYILGEKMNDYDFCNTENGLREIQCMAVQMVNYIKTYWVNACMEYNA